MRDVPSRRWRRPRRSARRFAPGVLPPTRERRDNGVTGRTPNGVTGRTPSRFETSLPTQMRKQAAFADTLKKGSKVFVTKKGVETIATVVTS